MLILQRNMRGLWLGVGMACVSALMTVLVFVFPLRAIALLTIDFLVLFALLTESEGFTALRRAHRARRRSHHDGRAAARNEDACHGQSRVFAGA